MTPEEVRNLITYAQAAAAAAQEAATLQIAAETKLGEALTSGEASKQIWVEFEEAKEAAHQAEGRRVAAWLAVREATGAAWS